MLHAAFCVSLYKRSVNSHFGPLGLPPPTRTIYTDGYLLSAAPSLSQQGAAAWRAFSSDGQLVQPDPEAAAFPPSHAPEFVAESAKLPRQVLSSHLPQILVALQTEKAACLPAKWLHYITVCWACTSCTFSP